MIYRDRKQAANLLSEKLLRFISENPLILGIPRGSVPMAKTTADRLNGEVDVVLVHKIGAPNNPEFAIGSVSEFGTLYLSEACEWYEIPSEYIESASSQEIFKLKQRRKTYSPIRPPINPKGRTVIIVDDGIATGATMLAAVRAVRSQDPRQIIVAAPVASLSAVEILKKEVDELIILETPEDFFSISQFYDNFPQVSDEEVFQILSEAGSIKKAA
jgi:predicted phosphoribosyltransferase